VNIQVPFSWPDYLKEVKAQAAPASCFKQCPVPPENEFTIGTFILHLNSHLRKCGNVKVEKQGILPFVNITKFKNLTILKDII
jgi:hypothetical protein